MVRANSKRLLYRVTSYITMPSIRVAVLACAAIVLLTLWVASNNGASFGTSNGSVTVQSYGTIASSVDLPQQNMLLNPDFSQGYAYWGGENGWRADQNPEGFAFIDYSQGHDAPPCMKLEPDPYGIGPAQGDQGDSGACWQGFSITPGCIIRFGVWVKTDDNPWYSYNPSSPYGARFGCDFRDLPSYQIIGGGQMINCSVPVINGCPTVCWGTTSWTLIEWYVRAPYNANSATPWFQAFPYQSGVTAACYFDDAYAYIVG